MKRNLKTIWRLMATCILFAIIFTATATGENTPWKCPDCGQYNWSNYCSNCAHSAPWIDDESGYSSNSGRYQRSDFSRVGNIVRFGRYEQDNYGPNGMENIEWIVLDVQDGKCLLLSRYGLDVKRYNDRQINTTWENCSLRRWLNEEFLCIAFDSGEQSAIIKSFVDNSYRQGSNIWSTTGGNDTWDQIFLLSCTEAYRYMNAVPDNREYAKPRVAPTVYAKSRGAYTEGGYKTEDGRAAGWWWLRSPGRNQNQAARVARGGWIGYNHVDVNDGCIRPALWVNLGSDIF